MNADLSPEKFSESKRSGDAVWNQLLDAIRTKIDNLSVVEGALTEVNVTMSGSVALVFESGNGYWLNLNKQAEVTLD